MRPRTRRALPALKPGHVCHPTNRVGDGSGRLKRLEVPSARDVDEGHTVAHLLLEQVPVARGGHLIVEALNDQVWNLAGR